MNNSFIQLYALRRIGCSKDQFFIEFLVFSIFLGYTGEGKKSSILSIPSMAYCLRQSTFSQWILGLSSASTISLQPHISSITSPHVVVGSIYCW
uniref:Uncharacterized protein n=1 Tax=Trichobilharzia regenti TaxID=157069 RepID=A0AA85IY97_TRIRE